MEEKPLHLLILEDNPDDAELAVKELEREGFTLEWSRVDTEKGFREALSKKPDLILADYKLPSFSGLAALEIRRKLAADIPLIVVSGTIGEEAAVECMKSGATDYVLKDKLSRLVPVVKRALKEAEEHKKLLQAEEKIRIFSQAVNSSIDGFAMSDLNGKINYVNKAFTEMFGYLEEELIGKEIAFLHSEKQIPAFKKALKSAMEHSWSGELIGKRKNGELFPIEIFASRVLDDKGKVIAYQASHRDVTERKQAEDALKSSEERLKILFKSAPDAYYLSDLKGTFIDGNKAAEDLMRFKKEELIGKSFLKLKLLSAKGMLKASKLLMKNVLGKGTGPDEFTLMRKDGTQAIVEISTYPVKIKDKTVVLGIARDITERKRVEEVLRESEEKYRQLVNYAPSGILELDIVNNKFITVNEVACEYTGYSKEELLSMNLFDLLTEDSKRLFMERVSKMSEGEQIPEGVEYKIATKDGQEMVCMINSRITFDEDGKPIRSTIVAHDITDLRQVEEEKGKLQNQLLQAQKMEAIGILAGGVAHDFNNILTAILGYTDLAMMKVDEADPLYRDLKQIDLSATRAASLTRQLLLFSRRQPIQFTSFNLNTTVDNLLKMLHRLIGEDITINTELDSELWTVQADAGNIEQVIMNLTVNARDAMPEGGILTIKTENMHVDEDYCKTYTYAHPGKFVCLSVQDNGVGMDKEIINSIFEPFFTTKGPGKGTGMGLSVVYGVVKQHEGWVNVYSEPGQGSNLKIYLPASSLKAEEETKETVSLKELKGSGERILLVEDEEEVREFATMVLGENGYVVYDAANAEEALDMFDKEAGSFDLIFSDVVLPGKSGIQLIDQLLSRKGELRILLSSGYTDHKSQWPVIEGRGFRFLQKPYGLTDLLRAIKGAIKQEDN